LHLSPDSSEVNGGDSQNHHALWARLESVMLSKQSHVQQILEEFGIAADVLPDSDLLEEQMWRVVQGEITLPEATDLV
jgi:hypothetical protein